MEPLNEQPVEMNVIEKEPVFEPKPVAKVIISATALIASFTAGTQLDSEQVKVLQDDNQAKVEQISVLENEKKTIEDLKTGVTERYVYSQISSGRIPVIDSTISLNDVQTAYKNIVGEVNLNDKDLFIKGKQVAESKGDYVCK